MSLTIEDGTIVAGADAYISVANAEQYYIDFGKDTTLWDALTTISKEAKIRQALQYMDNKYYWKGFQATQGHDTQWPRSGVIIEESELLDTSIPKEITYANAILALEAVSGSLLTNVDNSSTGGAVKSTGVELGPLGDRIEYFSGGSKSQQIEYTEVDVMLRKYTESGNIVSGERS